MKEKRELQRHNHTIQLSDMVRVTDPCYDMDVWCAGTLKDVLPGEYACFSQESDQGSWGMRIAWIEVRHKDYPDAVFQEYANFEVGVDSGQCGIFDLAYYKAYHRNEIWYEMIGEKTYAPKANPQYKRFEDSSYYEEGQDESVRLNAQVQYMKSIESWKQVRGFCADTVDGKGFVSSSGMGDGEYSCQIARNEDGKIVGIRVDFCNCEQIN